MTIVSGISVIDTSNGVDSNYRTKDAETPNTTTRCNNTAAKHNKTRAILITGVITLVLIVVGGVTALVTILTRNSDKSNDDFSPSYEVCNTTVCEKAATSIRNTIDTRISPCDNFYQFACGTWEDKNVIEDDNWMISRLMKLQDNVDETLQDLLLGTKYDFHATQQARYFYQSCMDENQIEDLGTQPLISILEDLGGWPVLGSNPGGNWHIANFSLQHVLLSLQQRAIFPWVQVRVGVDIKDTDVYHIHLDEGNDLSTAPLIKRLSEDQKYLYSKNVNKAYVEYGTKLAILLGADPETILSDFNTFMKIESELKNIKISTKVKQQNDLYHKLNLRDLTRNNNMADISFNGSTHQFVWKDYISSVMAMQEVDITISESEPIIVNALEFIQQLPKVLEQFTPRDIANSFGFRLALESAQYMSSPFREARQDFYEVVAGISVQLPRWRQCVLKDGASFPLPLSHMYIKEKFHQHSRRQMEIMVEKLKDSFHDLIDESTWLNEVTKDLAQEKLQAMRYVVGYSDIVLNTTEIDRMYENVNVHPATYFDNVYFTRMNYIRNNLKKLRNPNVEAAFEAYPIAVNAFYEPMSNSIKLPLAFLQPPVYSIDYPASLNFGSIGVIVGHELTHGFDNNGRQYNADGELVNWWDDHMIRAFNSQTQCMIKQYDGMYMPQVGLYVNGLQTLSENIADNGGLKESYRAYKKYISESGIDELILPGLSYTPDQLFFLSFAQTYCCNFRDEALISLHISDPHTTSEPRVNGVIQNSKDFGRVFNCPVNSNMNPSHKCHVW